MEIYVLVMEHVIIKIKVIVSFIKGSSFSISDDFKIFCQYFE